MTDLLLFRDALVMAPRPLGRMDVLVGGGRVLAIAPKLAAPPSDWPCEEIACEGLVLAPGLIDCHTHLCGGGGEGGAHTRVPAVLLSALTTAGVTTAIGLLGTDGTTRTIAELLATARGLAHYGVNALCYTGSYELPPVTLTGSIRGDLVHVDRIVAVGELAISDHRSSQPSFEELIRVAADAHVSGMMTGKAGLLHLHLGDGQRGLQLVRRAIEETELPARVFHPTHVNRNHRLFAEAKSISDRGVTIDVTAFPPDDHGPGAGEAIAGYLAEGHDPSRITLSSDGGGCLPDFDGDGNLIKMGVGASASLLVAIREAVDLGVPLHRALATCTSNPAALFRLHGRGAVAPGGVADLVLLDDGLRVVHTLAEGRFLVRDGAPVVRGAFET